MDHKILKINNEQQQEEAKETKIPKGQGVIFIKTRMSDNKIHDLVSISLVNMKQSRRHMKKLKQ
ncbi:hypothetical protein [Novisyntrophococcus fermenticellae]|uniref:hypothetical protein n=1 Tax=Novisyntrophococcus fermenticellae TaxID=2068655 RepID=UPI001E3C5F1D|nr:hypothetical protein [Novisyntrophococcus fermenticellae]